MPAKPAAFRASRCSSARPPWVGGVDSAETALEKIRAGADLVQLYTGMIYAGPSLPGRIVAGMSSLADREGLKSIRELRDSKLADWLAKPI